MAAFHTALHAQGTPIGFPETWALSTDRQQAIATLIPGTDDWYYYQCRERLDARDFAAVRNLLPTWIERHQRNQRVVEIEHRLALLGYSDNKAGTYQYLRNQLGLGYGHERVVPGQSSDLPHRLDANLISPRVLTERAMQWHPGSVQGFTNRALPSLATVKLDENRLRDWLQRLDRPDVDNLPALVVRELERRESGGFGALPIHRRLWRSQLEECVRLRPALLADRNFVDAFLVQLQPDSDQSWQLDADARAQQLARLWEFVQRLSPAFNSLKAHVLCHWLQHDLGKGAPDKQRFLAYLQLPRRTGHPARALLERVGRNEEWVDLRQQPPTLLPAVNDDEALLRTCFEHFFAKEDGYEAYTQFVDANWLKGVFAETKLLLGQGDLERMYSLLNDPARVQALEQRVELSFPPTLPSHFGADDDVKLTVDTKNVRTLLVKVFAIDAFRYHVEKQKEVDATIELDGVVPNHEQSYTYDEPALRRVRRTFDLPMLKAPGTYVVEFVGNGLSSRAVVHKGELRTVERTAAGGQLLRIYDEAGRQVKDASAWLGGREYTPNADGELLLPFSTEPGQRQIVLRSGNRSSIARIDHRGEAYQLHGGVFVARESLVAGQKAKVLLRPQLQLGGHDVALSLLTQRVLTITATDLDGLSTTQEVRDPELIDERELAHEITVPERLQSLQIQLRGVVKDLAGKDVALATPGASFVVNGIDQTAETGSVLLVHTDAGYFVEMRGKDGEPLAGRACNLMLQHGDYTDGVDVVLQTDKNGRIELGALPGIDTLQVNPQQGTGTVFALAGGASRWPAVLHGQIGETLRVPAASAATTPTRAEYSLLGEHNDEFSRLAIQNGMLELRELPPGEHQLLLHRSDTRILVRITRGTRDGAFLVSRDRVLGSSALAPMLLRQPTIVGNELVIQIDNAGPDTRVHLVGTRYHMAADALRALSGAGGLLPPAFGTDRAESTYHAERKLGDEYRYVLERRYATKFPGNMLARPSLLANPWALEDSWNAAIGQGGGGGGHYGRRAGKPAGAPAPALVGSAAAGIGPAGAFASLDFLPRGAVVRANLQPGKDGMIRVPLAELEDAAQVHVMALDADAAQHRTVLRAAAELKPRRRALPRALDGSQHFLEQKRIEFVAGGGSTALDDARSAQVEIHDSLASVFRLFTTITRNDDLAKFAFVIRWPQLADAEKKSLYSQHACHELNFFLFKKDPTFFATAIKPLLADKLEKTFLDQWLLGADLRAFVEPRAFGRLNLIERILLAQRLGGAQRDGIVRRLREELEVRPVDRERLRQLIDLALASDQLDAKNDGAVGLLRAELDAAEQSAPRDDDAMPSVGQSADKAKKSRAGMAKDESGAKVEVADEEQAEAAPSRLRDMPGESERRGNELKQRGQAAPLYRAVDKTKILVEHNWWHTRMADTSADAVAPNRFWADFALAPADQPFVSAAIVEASTSFLEMLMALAVLDLPFAGGKHDITADGNRRQLKAGSPLLLVRKEVAKVEKAADTAPLLLGQNYFRLDDRYRHENGERLDAFVTDEFLVGVAYGCQVVVTNPTSSPRKADVLLQIPRGAVPLQRGFWTKGIGVDLAPYATQTIEYAFYFPGPGEQPHYPVHAAERGKLAAFAEARSLKVVTAPSKLDTTSWEHVSQQGAPDQVLAYLDGANLQRTELGKIAWRMRDREFFNTVLTKLRARHVYDDTLWSYGLLHQDEVASREYLRHAEGFLQQCGFCLESPLITLDPRERRLFEQMELDPLVHARAHRLGAQHVLGNADLINQYGSLMTLLGYRPRLDDSDWLVVTYYLLLQDRVEDALASFRKVDPAKVAAKVQYDYLSAYLCFFTGDTQKARELAERHKQHPVEHWQKRFLAVLAQLDESKGLGGAGSGEPMADAIAKAPALELGISGTTLSIAHKNLPRCEVRYYELDVEFAFSAQPFASAGGTSAAFVQPSASEQRDLPAGGGQLQFELPERFRQKNVLVEVRAAGLLRSKQYFANAMSVRFLESFGQVAVTTPDTGAPLPKTYVKVFAKLPGGAERFHKDGYTDIRGRFDYASVSDDPNAGAVRYAVLVLDEQRGAVIREVAPPAK